MLVYKTWNSHYFLKRYSTILIKSVTAHFSWLPKYKFAKTILLHYRLWMFFLFSSWNAVFENTSSHNTEYYPISIWNLVFSFFPIAQRHSCISFQCINKVSWNLLKDLRSYNNIRIYINNHTNVHYQVYIIRISHCTTCIW